MASFPDDQSRQRLAIEASGQRPVRIIASLAGTNRFFCIGGIEMAYASASLGTGLTEAKSRGKSDEQVLC